MFLELKLGLNEIRLGEVLSLISVDQKNSLKSLKKIAK